MLRERERERDEENGGVEGRGAVRSSTSVLSGGKQKRLN